MTVVYAILQNYVTDFTCGCGYFTVFIYVEFIVCCVEIAGAVYKERHNTVFICSTYGQVVLGVQCVSLNGICIYITVFIYGEFIVCCVECAGAVYKERHDSVFCHSAYGQVVFGVQSVGLNGVYINVFVQLNLICLLTILISFFYGNVTAVYYFRMLRRFCSCAICLIFDQFKLFFRCRSASRCKILTV